MEIDSIRFLLYNLELLFKICLEPGNLARLQTGLFIHLYLSKMYRTFN